MADSGGIIPSKCSDKTKLPNSINRTTSETLRLTDSERIAGQPSSLSSSTPRKKTSFVITSITSRTSNDQGEDSADDLDESHTEDISEIVDNSRVTDIENETPSYSEDTFSKDDVFFNASSSLVSAPVIPTSSQYGLALVPTTEVNEHSLHSADNCDLSGNSELRVEANESVINLGVVSTKHDPEMRDLHPPAPRAERFKVVKIESTEPFKRGRWICMDYLDHPNIAQNVSLNNSKSDCDISPHPTSEASDSISITNSVASVVTAATILADEQKQQVNNTVNEVSNSQAMQPSDNNQVVNSQQQAMPSTIPTNFTSVSPGQSLQNNLQMTPQNIVNSNNTAQTQQQPQQTQSQSLSQVHMQQILANSSAHQSLQPQQIQQVLASATIPQQNQQPVQTQQSAAPQTQPPQQQLPQQQQQIQQQPQQQQQPPPMMQPQAIAQQMPSIPQYQPQQQAQSAMSQQQQYQAMQQQQQQQQQPQMMQQQIQPQMPPVQQVHMQPQQNIQQMPIQQQSQQPQMIQQPMQQMPQQLPTQVSYSQPMGQSQPTVVTQTSNQGMMQQTMHPQMQNYQQSQMMPNIQPQAIMNMQGQPHLQPQYYQNAMPQTAPLMSSQGGMIPSMTQSGTVGQVTMQNTTGSLPPLQSYSNVTQQQLQQVPGLPQTPPIQTSMPQYSLPMSMSQQTPMQPMTQPLPSMAMQQPPISYSVPATQTYPQVSSVPSSSVDIRSVIAADHSHETIPAPTAALLESLAEVTATGDEQPQGEDPENASGASAVAIDNKIEQAMDLVKSHLMFAVREEVEVLKEKIAELMERITQLESENTILRASANPETLAQLTSSQSSQTSNPP